MVESIKGYKFQNTNQLEMRERERERERNWV